MSLKKLLKGWVTPTEQSFQLYAGLHYMTTIPCCGKKDALQQARKMCSERSISPAFARVALVVAQEVGK